MAIADSEPKKSPDGSLTGAVKLTCVEGDSSERSCSGAVGRPGPAKMYGLYRNIKDFAFSMPSGWDDRNISIFLECCKENIEDLRNSKDDENKVWFTIAKSGSEKSGSTNCFTVNSCIELAECLKAYVIRNEKRIDNEAFKTLYNDVFEFLPYFPNVTVQKSVPQTRSKVFDASKEGASNSQQGDIRVEERTKMLMPIDLILISIGRQFKSWFEKGSSHEYIWNQMAVKVFQTHGVKLDVMKYLEGVKRNIINEANKHVGRDRAQLFLYLTSDYLPFFDYMPPTRVTKEDFLGPNLEHMPPGLSIGRRSNLIDSSSPDNAGSSGRKGRRQNNNDEASVSSVVTGGMTFAARKGGRKKKYTITVPKKDGKWEKNLETRKKESGSRDTSSEKPSTNQSVASRSKAARLSSLVKVKLIDPHPIVGVVIKSNAPEENKTRRGRPRKLDTPNVRLRKMPHRQVKSVSMSSFDTRGSSPPRERAGKAATPKRGRKGGNRKRSTESSSAEESPAKKYPRSVKSKENISNNLTETSGSSEENDEGPTSRRIESEERNRPSTSMSEPLSESEGNIKNAVVMLTNICHSGSQSSRGQPSSSIDNPAQDQACTSPETSQRERPTSNDPPSNSHDSTVPNNHQGEGSRVPGCDLHNKAHAPYTSTSYNNGIRAGYVQEEISNLEGMDADTIGIIENYKARVNETQPKALMQLMPAGSPNNIIVPVAKSVLGSGELVSNPPDWFGNFVTDLRKHESWKMHQLLKMQQELVDMENKKLSVLSRILDTLKKD